MALSAEDAYAAGIADALSACRHALQPGRRSFPSANRADALIQDKLQERWIERIANGELPPLEGMQVAS